MSPAAIITGARDPSITYIYLPQNSEVEEHSRAAWRNTITAVSDELLLMEKGIGERTQSTVVDLLKNRLGMPEGIALALIEAAIKQQEGFCVECDTVFELGGIGGPRHYENFRIR